MNIIKKSLKFQSVFLAICLSMSFVTLHESRRKNAREI